MFGNLTFMIPAGAPQARVPPKDVPPPTPLVFPRCRPQAPDHQWSDDQAPASGKPPKPLASVLQSIVRPTDLSVAHLEALGTHVFSDAAPAQLIPDPAFIPDFDAWHALSTEEVHARNEGTRQRLNTGNLSPGCQTYLERKRELSIPNEAAYRTIRRIPAPKGQPQARLGNAYEFYRHLELFSSFWEDTSKPPAPESKADQARQTEQQADGEDEATAADSNKSPDDSSEAPVSFRTGAGHQMPPDYRQNMITAFLKLVAYDFACNVSAPRTEPRLQITSRPSSSTGSARSSYFSSGCTFIFRTPTTREAARAGIVEGPVAAVSARHTIFPEPTSPSPPPTDRESTLDLARELVAALITAQHRAREGRAEKRIGEDAWWCTKPRWGGGSGGPIGREVEMLSGADQTIGDKDAPPPPRQSSSSSSGSSRNDAPTSSSSSSSSSLPQRPFSRPSGLPISHSTTNNPSSHSSSSSSTNPSSSTSSSTTSSSSSKGVKRLKKSGNHPMYDNYRMVRPPAATWDRKTRYEAIGRARGVGYDDVFVVSALLHHVSILRVRVPDALLAALAGEEETGSVGVDGMGNGTGRRAWGRLEVWRSKWFDFFQVEERVEAMQLVWSMMAYMMRQQQEEGQQGQGDVKMTGA